jgi:signal transduction histidine kinase
VGTAVGRGIIGHSDIQPKIDLPAETEQLIFRTAQETLRSVGKHAQARGVHVQLLTSEDRFGTWLRLRVQVA